MPDKGPVDADRGRQKCFASPWHLRCIHYPINEYFNRLTVDKGASRKTIEGDSRDLGRHAGFVGKEGTRKLTSVPALSSAPGMGRFAGKAKRVAFPNSGL
jgi:hypothetical protein